LGYISHYVYQFIRPFALRSLLVEVLCAIPSSHRASILT
jgi:hypothetical protein